jgi:bacterial/archaeal transporter family-2 protein
MQWTQLFALALAVLAGAVVPLQAGANAQLGRALGHPLWATLASLVVSAIALLPLLLAFSAPAPHLLRATDGPWWSWLGGLAGLFYISMALILTPRMGASSFIVAVIAGQIVMAMLLDQFGWLGLPRSPITLQKAMGGLFVVAGFITISKA